MPYLGTVEKEPNMASQDEEVMMEDSNPQQEDAVVDMPDSSVDDIPTNEYSDDNIDDIVEEEKTERPAQESVDQYADGVDDVEATAAGGEVEGGEEVEGGATTGAEGVEEEQPAVTTPKKGKAKGKEKGKTLKQRLGQSKHSLYY